MGYNKTNALACNRGEKLVKITTDSCADLTQQQYKDNNISVLPLFVTLGDDDYLDGVTICPQRIFDYVAQTKVLPKTAARSIEDYKEFFLQALQEENEVFYTGISSKLSSSFSNAQKAVEELGTDKIFVVDSLSLSTGIGNLVLLASKLAQAGKSGKEIAEIIEEQAKHNQASFIVDNLDYLYKGGRCSAMAKFGANLLKIKPRLELVDGEIKNTGKYMGNFKVACKKYIDDMLNLHSNHQGGIAFITHTCKDEEFVQSMVDYVKSKNMFKEVVSTRAGATITSHCGENTLGILYLLEE